MINAPDFPAQATWLNTDQPLSLAKCKGQVVILDFWTYCCINCIHTVPDLNYLEEKFHDQPVVIIGVHAAKFLNEQNPDNIQSAIDRYEIGHPVIVDNDHHIWDSYAVRAWPTLVVIDPEGKIVTEFSGEGHRLELETIIEKVLTKAKKNHTLASEPLPITHTAHPSTTTLHYPGKITFDPTGQLLFISDSNHNRILVTKLVNPTQAEITHLIGTGVAGQEDDDFTIATFNHPQGMVLSGPHLYVCDTGNHLIRDINLEEETITTLAGTGEVGAFRAAGGPALSTALNSPWDICSVDHYLFVAMAGSHQIWRYDFQTQEIQPFIGTGDENLVDGSRLTSQLAQPSGITYDKTLDSLVWADSEVSAVRGLSFKSQQVETMVGQGLFTFGLKDGSFDHTLLQHCLGLTSKDTLIYVADTYNHAIRLLDTATHTSSTLIKRESKTECKIGDINCALLPLNEPSDVKLSDHYLYIADTNNHLIRAFDLERHQLIDVILVAKEAPTIDTKPETVVQT